MLGRSDAPIGPPSWRSNLFVLSKTMFEEANGAGERVAASEGFAERKVRRSTYLYGFFHSAQPSYYQQ